MRAEDRERREHLCRYLLRPPLADRRLRLLPAEQVALELKTPWRDSTRWLTMSAETFLERLCSLVPRPMARRRRTRALRAPLLGVRGRIEEAEGVRHLIAESLFHPENLPHSAPRSRDFH